MMDQALFKEPYTLLIHLLQQSHRIGMIISSILRDEEMQATHGK